MARSTLWRTLTIIVASISLILTACGGGESADEADGTSSDPDADVTATQNGVDDADDADLERDVYEINESFWASGWIWHIENLTIDYQLWGNAQAEIDASIENIGFAETEVPNDWAKLIVSGEEHPFYTNEAPVAPGDSISVTYEFNLDTEIDEETGIPTKIDPADVQLVWGEEREFRAMYALDGSESRTNEPLPIDLDDFTIEGVHYDIQDAALRYEQFGRSFNNEYVYLSFQMVVTNNGDHDHRMHPWKFQLADGRSIGPTIVYESPEGGLEGVEPMETWIHLEIGPDELESGPVSLVSIGLEDEEVFTTFEIPDPRG